MTKARQLELLDMVAVLNSSGAPDIHAGDVGAAVELLPPDALEVEFLSGWVYQYYGVPGHLHEQMMEAPSKGRFLNMYIRDNYPYSRVG